jgi:Protein of unknown function (DUF4019)
MLIASLLVLAASDAAVWDGRAQGSDRDRAEQEASSFLQGLDEADLTDVYRLHAGPTFMAGMPQDRFVEQLGIARIQSGGPATSRQLVGGQPFRQTPTGQQGNFYYFRYKASFPSGVSVFQDTYLEKAGSDWKVAGYWVFPIPPPPPGGRR